MAIGKSHVVSLSLFCIQGRRVDAGCHTKQKNLKNKT
jgi:hypothetical protein